jgi:uncharacterized membrane protein YvbJ
VHLALDSRATNFQKVLDQVSSTRRVEIAVQLLSSQIYKLKESDILKSDGEAFILNKNCRQRIDDST